MSHQVLDLLLEQMDKVWLTLRHRLEGLSEHEHFWQPVRDYWTLRQDQTGRRIRDCADPAPDPPPFATIAWLETGQARLRQSLSALQDSEIAKRRATNWGERWPTWRIFWTMIFHDAYHGAETACLRDL